MVFSPLSKKNSYCNNAKKYYCSSNTDKLDDLCNIKKKSQQGNLVSAQHSVSGNGVAQGAETSRSKNYSYNNLYKNIYTEKQNSTNEQYPIIYDYPDNIENNHILIYDCNNKQLSENDQFLNNMCKKCNFKNIIKQNKNTFDEIDMNIVEQQLRKNSENFKLNQPKIEKKKSNSIKKIHRNLPYEKFKFNFSTYKRICINFYDSKNFKTIIIILIIIVILLIWS